ncbi:hypothetical protein QWA68_015307 [Fusarium oxysporum]|nr:hypothetical protein QWA68_015307 [Fusarium oxysporum]
MDYDERLNLFDTIALLVELDDCGKKRHLRNCNECRFRKGVLYTQFRGFRGTRQFPVVPTRQAFFATVLDRYFPGFLNTLKCKGPSVKLPGVYDQLYTMYMARCTRCKSWQEIRSFRIGGRYHSWRPSIRWDTMLPVQGFDKSCCNTCLVDSRGQGELADSLGKWFVAMLNDRLHYLSSQLSKPLNSHQYTPVKRLPGIEAAEWKLLLEQTPWFDRDPNFRLSNKDVDLINIRRGQRKDLLDKAKNSDDEKWQYLVLEELYDDWVRNSAATEQQWRWLMACKEEVEDNPELLVDWALNRGWGCIYVGLVRCLCGLDSCYDTQIKNDIRKHMKTKRLLLPLSSWLARFIEHMAEAKRKTQKSEVAE